MNRLFAWFPSLVSLQHRYASVSSRERFLLGIAAYFLLGLFLYYFVLAPSLGYQAEKLRTQVTVTNGLQWMEANRSEAMRQMGGSGTLRVDNELTTISSSADLYKVAIKRMQPRENQISVELSGQSYLALIRWLVALEAEHGFKIVDARIDKVSDGIVDSRITLR